MKEFKVGDVISWGNKYGHAVWGTISRISDKGMITAVPERGGDAVAFRHWKYGGYACSPVPRYQIEMRAWMARSPDCTRLYITSGLGYSRTRHLRMDDAVLTPELLVDIDRDMALIRAWLESMPIEEAPDEQE